MNGLSHENDFLSRLTDAFGLPRSEGWAAAAIRCLSVWFLRNLGWIVGGLVTPIHLPEFRPSPGWAYWSLWCGGSIGVRQAKKARRILHVGRTLGTAGGRGHERDADAVDDQVEDLRRAGESRIGLERLRMQVEDREQFIERCLALVVEHPGRE